MIQQKSSQFRPTFPANVWAEMTLHVFVYALHKGMKMGCGLHKINFVGIFIYMVKAAAPHGGMHAIISQGEDAHTTHIIYL